MFRNFTMAAVLVLGGCDSAVADDVEAGSDETFTPVPGDDESESSEEDGSSSDDGAAVVPEDGELLGKCTTHDDCYTGDDPREGVGYRTCSGNTCVEVLAASAVNAWLNDAVSACETGSTVVIIGEPGFPEGLCAMEAEIIDDLGVCPEGMTAAVWSASTRTTVTCWWATDLMSGQRCEGDDECGGECVTQPYAGGGELPSVCG
jgi:hypothetical protein